MATQIEDEPLPWYLDNADIGTCTVEVMQYEDLMKAKNKKQETGGKMDCQRNLKYWQTDFQEK